MADIQQPFGLLTNMHICMFTNFVHSRMLQESACARLPPGSEPIQVGEQAWECIHSLPVVWLIHVAKVADCLVPCRPVTQLQAWSCRNNHHQSAGITSTSGHAPSF